MQGYSTVAVIAVTPGVPLQNIAAEIVYSLQELGTAVCITPEVVKTNLGFNALDQSNDFKLTAWLGAQEDHYNTVIYLVSQEESSVPGIKPTILLPPTCMSISGKLSYLILIVLMYSAMTTAT